MSKHKRYVPYSVRQKKKAAHWRWILLLILIGVVAWFGWEKINQDEAELNATSEPMVAEPKGFEPEREVNLDSESVNPRNVTEVPTETETSVSEPMNTESIADGATTEDINDDGKGLPVAGVIGHVDNDVIEEIKKIKQDIQAGKVIEARHKYNSILQSKPLTETLRNNIKSDMTLLSQKWLFNKEVLPGDNLCDYYKVKRNENLSTIGQEYNVPYQFLMTINGIAEARSLRMDQRIKILNGPFNAVVNKSTFTLDLYLQTTYVCSYKIAIGTNQYDTPTGLWRVTRGGKMVRPSWTDPDTKKYYTKSDPDYPLGDRWIALTGIEGNAKGRTGFALHGTNDPGSIGTRASRGCIRLKNKEIIELYHILQEGVSEVRVVD